MHSSHQHARKIAEAVNDAWHGAHGHGNVEVPVSVVAALSFISPPQGERGDLESWLRSLDVDDFTKLMRFQWRHFVHARPDLVNPAWPLINVWHGDHPLDESAIKAAKLAADAALRAGQLELTGSAMRTETDLFGALLSELRPPSARSARGQIYTPPDICSIIACLTDIHDRSVIHEPTAGTGGMLRAAAQAIRAQGGDPATVTWYAVDIDALAIACLAVNTVLWELGFKVVLGVADILTDDWIPRALAQRDESIDIANSARQARAFLDAYHALDTGAEQADDGSN
ncbi:N-6 DNA methylase family protein [Flindersiella endophytica]